MIALSSFQSCATVPATVTAPAGATSAKFNIATTAVGGTTTVTISATYGGATKPATLTVN